MKTSSLLIVGGLAGAYYLATTGFNSVQAVKNLDYSNPRIKFGKISLAQIELQMTLDFTNSSSQTVSMEYFTGFVNYQASPLASFTFDGKGANIVLKARTKTTVPFTVVIKNLPAITTLYNLYKKVSANQKINSVITIDSRFYAAGFDIPVKFDWDLKTNSLVPVEKKVSGIGDVNAKLSFKNNEEMINFFRQEQIKKFQPKFGFSKN